MASKDTFILRTDWSEAIMDLKPAEQATVFRNLFFYHADQHEKIDTTAPAVKLVWKLIEPSLRRNADAYERRAEIARANGKKGGRRSTTENNPDTEPRNPDTEPVTQRVPGFEPRKPIVSVSGSVSDSVPPNGGGGAPPANPEWAGLTEREAWVAGELMQQTGGKIPAARIRGEAQRLLAKKPDPFPSYITSWANNIRSDAERSPPAGTPPPPPSLPKGFV